MLKTFLCGHLLYLKTAIKYVDVNTIVSIFKITCAYALRPHMQRDIKRSTEDRLEKWAHAGFFLEPTW